MADRNTVDFLQALDSGEGTTKTAAAVTEVIRAAIKPERFCSQVIPPKTVTRDELIPALDTDQVVKLVQLEPNSKAQTVTFRDSPRANFVQARRIPVPFFTIMTEKYEKTEEELLAYSVPITDWLRKDMVYNIHAIEDHRFLTFAELAIQAMQEEYNGGNYATYGFNKTNLDAGDILPYAVAKGEGAMGSGVTDDYVIHPIQRGDLVTLKNIPAAKRLRCACILMSEVDHNDLGRLLMNDIGSNLAGETFVNGIKYTTLQGVRIVVTAHVEILRPGNVYGFVDPGYLGVFYNLKEPTFFVKKEGNLVSWWAWENLAMAFINVNGIAKLELYAGSVSTNYESVTPDYTSRTIIAEDQLYAIPVRDAGDSTWLPSVQW